ncbi:CBD9-like protein [Violaceomyces palustris]|uniref:CBD9-like protein n=1 Tax=Violaceomyces palustris TaxID=1673888 RepID=A0ACD0P351_9BASI|nr:CBD9-like protein [Violaceomyces palustris]
MALGRFWNKNLGLVLAAIACFLVSQARSQNLRTADSHCTTDFCLNAVYDPSKSVTDFTLSTTAGGQPIGWFGIGTGKTMAGSSIMVGWVNMDSSVTLSQRAATGHQPPTIDANGAAFTLDTASSFSNSSGTSMRWSVPTTNAPSNSVQYMWALNPTGPSSSAADSSIQRHTKHGDFILDMTKAYTDSQPSGSASTGGSTGSSTSSSSSDSGGSYSSGGLILNRYNRLVIAHMVFMAVGLLLIAPLAILIARWGRTYFSWFPTHRGLHFVTLVFVTIGFFISIAFVESAGEHFSNTHMRVGLAIFILVILQVIAGQLGHHTKKRSPLRLLHIFVGLVTVGLSVWNCSSGLESWYWGPPEYSRYIIYGWTGLIGLLYLAGLVLLPKQLREEKMRSDEGEGTQSQTDDREKLNGGAFPGKVSTNNTQPSTPPDEGSDGRRESA